MEYSRLEKNAVRDTSMWNLGVRFSPDAVDIAVYSDMEENSLICRHIDLDLAATTWLKAVENVVYDNPLLLNEFRRTKFIIEAGESTLFPARITDTADLAKLWRLTFPASESEAAFDFMPERGVTVAYGIPDGLSRFLRRTFPNTGLTSHLTVLIRYLMAVNRGGNARRMTVNLRRGSMDVIITDQGRMVLANVFDFPSPDDAAYYILACSREAGLTPETDILLAGDSEMREATGEILKKYVHTVMPVIFPPSMFRAGRDAMKAPFDLIVSNLCE